MKPIDFAEQRRMMTARALARQFRPEIEKIATLHPYDQEHRLCEIFYAALKMYNEGLEELCRSFERMAKEALDLKTEQAFLFPNPVVVTKETKSGS